MVKILVVEDDSVINQVVSEFLKEHHYQVESAFDGKAALNSFYRDRFDLIILDIMIPHVSGLEVLKEIRKSSAVPVMMLTAMADEATQLLSFNHLISDYVTKPFSPLILMKRIENILREKSNAASIIINDITIYPEEGSVYLLGEAVSLTKKEYDILLFLAERQGKIISRDLLMNSIWGYSELDSRVLDNHVKNLRKKLPSLPLKTVIGRGYQIEKVS
ncbi:response regulator transcription factor [Streptococcus sp. H31]|uniref:response regulator transcription factor n=1 Tax=Streptococcus huangxiaojuni TaxID=3237239 RepID=UPI0034A4BF59